jgi:hypothetical protein
MSGLEPTPEQFAALTARPADVPVVMVNLLKFHPESGLERYLQYGRDVAPHLERVGATVRYAGVRQGARASRRCLGSRRPDRDLVVVNRAGITLAPRCWRVASR